MSLTAEVSDGTDNEVNLFANVIRPIAPAICWRIANQRAGNGINHLRGIKLFYTRKPSQQSDEQSSAPPLPWRAATRQRLIYEFVIYGLLH